MKHILLLLCITAYIGSTVQAQNWKTVPMADTVYFRGASVDNPGSGNLRVIWVSDIEETGSDSVFHFYPTIREPAPYHCLDTLAPSWLGSKFIRKPDGAEYYFNSFGDTITIRTHAVEQERWILATDTSGIVFEGTVTGIEAQNIDRSPDSVKTIRIQAYQNGLPVEHLYNHRVLQLSREHGWVKALDFYRFPNHLEHHQNYFGTGTDTNQYTRLAWPFSYTDINRIDFQWRYKPGNEWITYSRSSYQVGVPASVATRHDSVMRTIVVNPEMVIAEVRRKEAGTRYTADGFPGQYTSESYFTVDVFYDTQYNNSGNTRIIRHTLYPEVPVLPDINDPGRRRFFAYNLDSICGRYVVRLSSGSHTGAYYFDSDSLCWGNFGISPGWIDASSETVLLGFGRIKSSSSSGERYSQSYSSTDYVYFKLGDCTYGTKTHLDISDLVFTGLESIRIYPNPAKGKVTLKADHHSEHVSVTDMAGKVIWQQKISEGTCTIDIQSWTKGVYLVQVHGKTGYKVVQKLVVQ